MKNIKQYYKELGKLVYALAISDGVIQENELYKLHETVSKDLAMNESSEDSSGMNQAFYVDFEFDKSVENHLDLNEAIKSYCDFVRMNCEPTDRGLFNRSLVLLKNVSEAYTDEKEKDIISKISKEMQESTKYLVN